MDNPVVSFIKLLTDNNIIPKYREIPDEFDLKDELLAEIELEMDGNLPDSMRYFEINGISNPVDLEEILENQFNSFKIALISGATVNKSGIKREINAQVSNANKELILLKQSVIPYKDITLNSLIDLKIRYIEKTLNVTLEENNISADELISKEASPVHVLRVKKEFEKTGFYIIQKLHKELKKAGYINCNFREFKKLFLLPDDKMPECTPSPVIWCANYAHFSYFFKCINRPFLNRSEEPGNFKIALDFLVRSADGTKFSTSQAKDQGHTNLEIKKRFDAIMRRIELQKITTFR
ncbi:MAG TPA: hypothetical protein PK816_16650 [Candidatus Cloacimonadota bacterium]|jgi:hypothetical protein|nr:hypothetical protein [Candidatus Cloacimonadota bacterium]